MKEECGRWEGGGGPGTSQSGGLHIAASGLGCMSPVVDSTPSLGVFRQASVPWSGPGGRKVEVEIAKAPRRGQKQALRVGRAGFIMFYKQGKVARKFRVSLLMVTSFCGMPQGLWRFDVQEQPEGSW